MLTPTEQFKWWRRFRPEMLLRRKSFHSLCYAPEVSLFFDPKGYVRSCCQSVTHSLGNIQTESLTEIWNGEKIESLRTTLRADQLPSGCATCKWEIENKNFAQSFSRVYDSHRVGSPGKQLPKTMWFMLGNSCNLECIHCYGEISSSIRKNRDGLKPLPRVYDDKFFEELEGFLPQLEMAIFLGGETFLCPENFRIWEMMIEKKSKTECVIVTNGTLYNKKIETIVKSLSCYLSISLDGAKKETIESVRQNGKYETIMENIKRFSDIAAIQKRKLELSFCILPNNFDEFPDFLLLADKLNCSASVNTVYHPAEHSLSALPEEDLIKVYENWKGRDAEMRSKLSSNKKTWLAEMSRLKNWLKRPSTMPDPMYLTPISYRFDKLTGVEDKTSQAGNSRAVPSYEEAKSTLLDWSGNLIVHQLSLDAEDTVSCVGNEFCGIPPQQVNLRKLSELLMSLREKYGADVEVVSDSFDGHHLDRTVRFTALDEKSTELRWIAIREPASDTQKYTLFASTRQS